MAILPALFRHTLLFQPGGTLETAYLLNRSEDGLYDPGP
jgi:hypothetical protein